MDARVCVRCASALGAVGALTARIGLPQPVTNLRGMVLPIGAVSDWVAALGGLGVFAATAWLAWIATKQMAAAQDQINAAVEQGQAIRDAARAQLQPIVFVHRKARVLGPDHNMDLAETQVGFTYYIANEGDGIALRIRHGVEINGRDKEFQGGEYRVLRADESAPTTRDPRTREPREDAGFIVDVDERAFPDARTTMRINTWARFENVFGDRFETRNPIDPMVPAVFTRLPSK